MITTRTASAYAPRVRQVRPPSPLGARAQIHEDLAALRASFSSLLTQIESFSRRLAAAETRYVLGDDTAAGLTARREALGLSQHQLAQRANVARQTVSDIERGRRDMPGMRAHLAAVLTALEGDGPR